jgi:3-phenylpropionate/trans-cinnamate dioxygenase ferredoxin component
MPNLTLPLSELQPDSLRQIEHAGTQLVVVRSNGKVFAFHDQCPHAFWPLSEGTLRNTILECAGHGWEFDLETGRCLTAPVYCLAPVAANIEGDTVRLHWPDSVAASSADCTA